MLSERYNGNVKEQKGCTYDGGGAVIASAMVEGK